MAEDKVELAPGKSLPGAEEPGKSEQESGFLKKYGLYLALAVFLLLLFMPTPEGMAPAGQKALAVFCGALTLWVAGTIPIHLTSMIAIVALILTGTVKESTAFRTLGFDVIWLMISAFVLTAAMVKSNLARRFALWMIMHFGGTPKRTLLILILVNFAITFFIPSTTARALSATCCSVFGP